MLDMLQGSWIFKSTGGGGVGLCRPGPGRPVSCLVLMPSTGGLACPVANLRRSEPHGLRANAAFTLPAWWELQKPRGLRGDLGFFLLSPVFPDTSFRLPCPGPALLRPSPCPPSLPALVGLYLEQTPEDVSTHPTEEP